MMRFNPPPEPPEFDKKARQPGNTWLAKNPDTKKRPRDYWSPFKSHLADGSVISVVIQQCMNLLAL
jgi:hypothetical protein